MAVAFAPMYRVPRPIPIPHPRPTAPQEKYGRLKSKRGGTTHAAVGRTARSPPTPHPPPAPMPRMPMGAPPNPQPEAVQIFRDHTSAKGAGALRRRVRSSVRYLSRIRSQRRCQNQRLTQRIFATPWHPVTRQLPSPRRVIQRSKATMSAVANFNRVAAEPK